VPDGGTDEKSLVTYVLANRTKLTFDKTLKEFRLPPLPDNGLQHPTPTP